MMIYDADDAWTELRMQLAELQQENERLQKRNDQLEDMDDRLRESNDSLRALLGRARDCVQVADWVCADLSAEEWMQLKEEIDAALGDVAQDKPELPTKEGSE